MAEIRTSDAGSYTVGQELGADTFAAGDVVDVTGTSKGKGFAGTMKRHGFSGVGASHGAHRNHRKPGSIGACATPGRVFKGLRMAGRMGGDVVTTQNVTVHAVDAEKGLVLLKGAVPGPRGGARGPPLGREEDGGHPVSAQDTARTVQVDLPAEIFDADQHPTDPPGRRGPAGRRPPGHARDQDPRRGPRRWPQALPQKGTGRARQGSTRAPQFAGGGIVHGPQPRSYVQRTPKKMKAAALRGALSDRARAGRVHVVEGLVDGDKPVDQAAVAALDGARPRTAPARGARARRRAHLAVAAQRAERAPDRRRPAEHLRRARRRRRGLHQGRLRRVRRPALGKATQSETGGGRRK